MNRPMNGNSAEQNSKDLMDIGRWVLLGILFVIFVGGITWVVLNTNVFKPKSISTNNNLLSFINFGKSPAPTTTAVNNTNSAINSAGNNMYIFTGTFVNVDTTRQLIFLKDANGKIYSFHISDYLSTDFDGDWLKIYSIKSLDDLKTKNVPDVYNANVDQATVFTDYTRTKIVNSLPAINMGNISVRWNDTRSIKEISDGMANFPNVPLNESQPNSAVLAAIK